MEDELSNRLLSENLKIMRNYINLKREIILLRVEKEDREKTFLNMQNRFDNTYNKFCSLEKSFKNIKEMQNELAYQNAFLVDKIRKLETLNNQLVENIKNQNTL